MLVNNISDPWLAHPKASMSLIVNHELIKCIGIQFELVGICWKTKYWIDSQCSLFHGPRHLNKYTTIAVIKYVLRPEVIMLFT